jgi:hypothetical protein
MNIIELYIKYIVVAIEDFGENLEKQQTGKAINNNLEVIQ